MALISLRFLKPRKRARRKPQGGPGQAPRSICVGPSHWKTPFLAFRSPGKPQGRGVPGFLCDPSKIPARRRLHLATSGNVVWTREKIFPLLYNQKPATNGHFSE